MDRIKLPDVADLVRDGTQWDDLVRRLSAWVPISAPVAEVTDSEPEVAVESVEEEIDLDSICAEVAAEVPMPTAPAVQPDQVPWYQATGQAYREGLETARQELYGVFAASAKPKPASATKAPAQADSPAAASTTKPASTAKPVIQSTTAKPVPAPAVELDPSDPRLALCSRLGEKPTVTSSDSGKDPMVWISSRCCPGKKKLSLLIAKPSGDILARPWCCGKKAFPASQLAPLGQDAPHATKVEPAATKAPPATMAPAATKVELAATKAAEAPAATKAKATAATDALDAAILGVLAAGPRPRTEVVEAVAATGVKATKGDLREARIRLGLRSYTYADEQWWALATTTIATTTASMIRPIQPAEKFVN